MFAVRQLCGSEPFLIRSMFFYPMSDECQKNGVRNMKEILFRLDRSVQTIGLTRIKAIGLQLCSVLLIGPVSFILMA